MEVFVISMGHLYYKSDGTWTLDPREAKWFGLRTTAAKTLKRLETTAKIKAVTVGEAQQQLFL